MSASAGPAAGLVRPFTLRAAAMTDLTRVAEIERASFADPWSEDDFSSVLHLAHTIFLVAEDAAAREVAGYVIALAVMDAAEILNIAVAPDHRKGGVGGVLLDAALAEVEKKGVESVFLEVRVSNAAARSLYASREFAEISIRKNYYRSPVEDALVMRRAVNG